VTEKGISNVIIANLAERKFPIYLKHFEGAGMSEADVLGINRGGYIYEYEIKISRSDFFADFKNKGYKHGLLKDGNGVRHYDEWKNGKRTGGVVELIGIPNRFYYACPSGLLKKEDIPEYAGLVYIEDSTFTEVKPAKLLHKTKANTRLYSRIATILSERNQWGCAYASYMIKEKIKRFEEFNKNNHEPNNHQQRDGLVGRDGTEIYI